jgi:hypothetical protein
LMHSGALTLFHTHTPCKQASGEGEKSRILSPARNKSAELWKRRSSSRIIKSIELQNESTAAALILQLQHHVRRFPKHLLADKWTCAYKELRRQYLAKKKRRARSLQLISCATHFYSSSRTHHPPIFASCAASPCSLV